MFEAHFSSTQSFPIQEKNRLFQNQAYSLYHHCPIWLWSASGKRILPDQPSQNTLFIYVEYKDKHNRARYHCITLPDQSRSQEIIVALATQLSLPGLCRQNTQRWLTQEFEESPHLI